MDKYFRHEGCDRTHMLLAMFEEAFGPIGDPINRHPSLHNERCIKLARKASSALAELYQAIGEWEEND